jgi:hypothetical protein
MDFHILRRPDVDARQNMILQDLPVGVQDARSTHTIKTNGINRATNLTNEEGWIKLKNKLEKCTFKERCPSLEGLIEAI